jgi:Uma2 family endonuclease
MARLWSHRPMLAAQTVYHAPHRPLAPATAPPPRAPTYADIEALPPHVVGEILGGELVVSPRPAIPHAHAGSTLGMLLGAAFQLGIGGPGGWHIVDEPELSLGVDPRFDPVVPDLAGWRTETLPTLPLTAQAKVVPDWVCEVCSPSTQRRDRVLKLPFYGRAGVRHAWLVDPLAQTLEVYRLVDGHWQLAGAYSGDETVRAEPFDAVDLPLALLWPQPAPEVTSDAPEAAPDTSGTAP